jgi:hypothetical protein
VFLTQGRECKVKEAGPDLLTSVRRPGNVYKREVSKEARCRPSSIRGVISGVANLLTTSGVQGIACDFLELIFN